MLPDLMFGLRCRIIYIDDAGANAGYDAGYAAGISAGCPYGTETNIRLISAQAGGL